MNTVALRRLGSRELQLAGGSASQTSLVLSFLVLFACCYSTRCIVGQSVACRQRLWVVLHAAV